MNSGGAEGTDWIILTVVIPQKKETGPVDSGNIENYQH